MKFEPGIAGAVDDGEGRRPGRRSVGVEHDRQYDQRRLCQHRHITGEHFADSLREEEDQRAESRDKEKARRADAEKNTGDAVVFAGAYILTDHGIAGCRKGIGNDAHDQAGLIIYTGKCGVDHALRVDPACRTLATKRGAAKTKSCFATLPCVRSLIIDWELLLLMLK